MSEILSYTVRNTEHMEVVDTSTMSDGEFNKFVMHEKFLRATSSDEEEFSVGDL